MVPFFGLGEEFFASLTKADAEIARQVAVGGCPWCEGPLHQANYLRKPRGGLFAIPGEAFPLRHSLCCGGRMKPIAQIHDPAVIRRILDHLDDKPAAGHPAPRGPPMH